MAIYAIKRVPNAYGGAISGYFYNTLTNMVMTKKTGTLLNMTWQKTSTDTFKWRVSFYTDRGRKIGYNREEILAMMDRSVNHDPVSSALYGRDVAVVDKPVAVAEVGTMDVKPTFPYVLFSVKNECSQYFFAGTSIADALGRLAKRGEHVNVADARILNVHTNKVHTLKAQVTTTYVLA